MSLIFVDCEAWGGCPATGQLTEFGAAEFSTWKTFHGIIVPSTPSSENPAIPVPKHKPVFAHETKVFKEFADWISQFPPSYIFISDNPAFDWMWICDGFHRTLGKNPFGHSARRIGDYYAGLVGDFKSASKWKKLRRTKHDHNPVHDCIGNLEAFSRIMQGER